MMARYLHKVAYNYKNKTQVNAKCNTELNSEKLCLCLSISMFAQINKSHPLATVKFGFHDSDLVCGECDRFGESTLFNYADTL